MQNRLAGDLALLGAQRELITKTISFRRAIWNTPRNISLTF